MSEGDAETVPGREIWIEKYRPQHLSEIHGQEDIVERLQSYIEKEDLPHLLFAGPAGTGKCVSSETPVLTNEGLEPIERVVGDIDGFAEPDDGLRVPSLADTDEFEYVRPSHVYSKSASGLERIETRDGSNVFVTPEHKLLVIDDEGLNWVRAENLEHGDRIARPRSIPVPETPALDWISELDEERIHVSIDSDFARRHDLPRNGASLGRLCELDVERAVLKESVEQVQYVSRFGRSTRPITPVWEVTPQLAEFVGLAISEAHIDGGRVKFYNTDKALLEAFADGLVELFGLEPEYGTQKDVPYVVARSRTLTHFLESTFDVFASASGEDPDAIGSSIITAGEDCRAAFLRAMFDAEGHVSQSGIIELTQRNERHITLLSYLLSTFGIPSRRKRDQKKATNGSGTEREYHTLLVSGAPALRRFQDAIGFSIAHKADDLSTHASQKSNPNYDTIPAQQTARELCDRLQLPVQELFTDSLDPETPGREAHIADVDAVLDAAVDRIEAAQEALAQLDAIQPAIDEVTRIPATWVDHRERLDPIETRRELETTSGVRPDRLLEYSDGRRSPTASRAGLLLVELDAVGETPAVETVQRTLQESIQKLSVDYATVAEDTDLRETDVIALLENDDHDIRTITRFDVVADRIRTLATDMLSQEVIGLLDRIERVVEADLYFDEITAIESVDDTKRVYDLTVPESRNYIAGRVPTVMHNTTSATAIAREVYGEDWRGNFLELNASDERGIDVVRDRIKSFARSSFGGYEYRIIFLDEADSLTDDAQSALRRTMEQFSDNTRFILSCNYSSKIIDPIQSRCAVFRFSPLSDEAVAAQAEEIAATENIELTHDGREALVYAAAGDMRRAINSLQAAATTGEVVDEEAVYHITATARPEEIEEMVGRAIEGDFTAARSTLDRLLTDTGMAGGDVIDQLHRSVWEFDISERDAVRLMERIGETDYRISEGANEQVQLEALLASLALND